MPGSFECVEASHLQCLYQTPWYLQTPRYPVQRSENHEEVKTRTGNAIRLREDLLTSAKRHKLKRYRHVTRSSGLAKTIHREQYKEGDEEVERA